MGEITQRFIISEENRKAHEKTMLLKNVLYPNAVTAYMEFYKSITRTASDEELEFMKLDLLTRQLTRKEAEQFIKSTEFACESLFGLDHDCGVDATYLLIAISKLAYNPSISEALKKHAMTQYVISQISEPKRKNILRNMFSIEHQIRTRTQQVTDWHNAIGIFNTTPERFGFETLVK